MLKFLTRKKNGTLKALDDAQRIYAVGDVHGRLDLFEQILDAIGQDIRSRPVEKFRIIFLGDLIDRGPDSAGVIGRAMQLSRMSSRLKFLKGNHEEIFLRAVKGDRRAAGFFYEIGGRSTLKSYGLDSTRGDRMSVDGLVGWMQENIPAEHVAFLDQFEDYATFGEYIFVHAGLRPFVPLEKQNPSDLRWIRREFTRFEGEFPGIVVHGHSISSEVDEGPFRIGIDTGAYASGRLTAIAIEGAERWFITAQGEPRLLSGIENSDDDVVASEAGQTIAAPGDGRGLLDKR